MIAKHTTKKRTEVKQLVLFTDAELIDVGQKLSLRVKDKDAMQAAYQAGKQLGIDGVERCCKRWNTTLSQHNGRHNSHYQYDDSRHIYDEFCLGYFHGYSERTQHGEADQNDDAEDATTEQPPKPRAPKYAAAMIRYRNQATGETWTGRGLQPAWVRQSLANGATLSQFEVTPP